MQDLLEHLPTKQNSTINIYYSRSKNILQTTFLTQQNG